ncbi:hypothetical protein CJ030_MR2G024661 [Morella rubra]|uniref:Uncharacterized protein n=1 Tax=Morella rubra TaxID=262757 RepID=A0A6A1WEM7_9ROSI|nr:hypothetical protein CJ030_MR2G024661 [Morella rubra]
MPLGLLELDDRSSLRRLGSSRILAELDPGIWGTATGWMDDMMTQLTERMQSVLQPTNEMVNDISCWLTTLEQKVMDMDSGWKKEIAAVQEAMRKAATSAELFALTQRVVHICDILKITNDDDYDL